MFVFAIQNLFSPTWHEEGWLCTFVFVRHSFLSVVFTANLMWSFYVRVLHSMFSATCSSGGGVKKNKHFGPNCISVLIKIFMETPQCGHEWSWKRFRKKCSSVGEAYMSQLSHVGMGKFQFILMKDAFFWMNSCNSLLLRGVVISNQWWLLLCGKGTTASQPNIKTWKGWIKNVFSLFRHKKKFKKPL